MSCHGFEKFFKREDKNMKRQGLKAFQTGSATAGLLHTYPGISSLEPSSVSTSSVIDRTDQPCFFLKATTENNICELFITKWTSITVYLRTPEIDSGVS